MVKQVLVIRKDLGMRKGKMVAQGAHASEKDFFDKAIYGHNEEYGDYMLIPIDQPTKEWARGKFTKAVVSVDSEEELFKIYNSAKEAGLNCSIIQDMGATEFYCIPTYTAVAVGPNEVEEVDLITGNLKLL